MHSEVKGKPKEGGLKLKLGRVSAQFNALVLVLLVASFAALVVACGDEPSPTAAPVSTTAQETAPEPQATPVPAPTPEPAATMAPEPAPVAVATTAPEPTPVPAATAAPEPTPTPAPTATPTPEPTPAPAATSTPQPAPPATEQPAAMPDPSTLSNDDLTQSFVTGAIEYYEENGVDATVQFYKSSTTTTTSGWSIRPDVAAGGAASGVRVACSLVT